MHLRTTTLALSLLIAGAACSKNGNRAADSSLNTDLSLAAQQRGYQPLDSLSPAERAAASNSLTGTAAGTAGAPVHRTASTTHASSSTTHRRSTSSGSRSSGSSGSSVGSSSGGSTSGGEV